MWPAARVGLLRSGTIGRKNASPGSMPGSMPNSVRVFLGFAFLLLAVLGIFLRYVVDEAVSAPISPLGVLWMGLLAYTIFTITLVLQRKEAGRSFGAGLTTVTIPAVPLLLINGLYPAGLVVAAAGIAVARAITRPSARAWLREQ